MFQSPLNKLVLEVKPKCIGNFTDIWRAAALNPGSELNPADLVNIQGEILSLPRSISQAGSYKGFTTKDMRVSDIAIFRYDVVYDMQPDPESTVPLYRNLVDYKEKEFFLADVQKIFGVIRNKEIIMVNGYVMLADLSPENTIVLPQYMQRITKAATGVVIGIGNNLEGKKKIDAQVGDTVYFRRNLTQQYQIKGKKYWILKQHQVLGKEVEVLN